MAKAKSPSTRRAWIEIILRPVFGATCPVALHPEGVDRNLFGYDIANLDRGVALHPEGVDRNIFLAFFL